MNTRAFHIIEHRKIWYIISTILILPGIISLFVWHLNIGIDFKGGSVDQLTFINTRPSADSIRTAVNNLDLEDATVQTAGDKSVIIQFSDKSGVDPKTQADAISTALGKLAPLNTSPNSMSFENIGGSVAADTTQKAAQAVVIAVVALILFIAFSFRTVPRPTNSWRFAITTIFALAHDILFVTGAFSIIGHFFPQIQVDSLFITALLTILGFSVNDTIVVFDRIRENLRRSKNTPFEEIVNASLNQTIARSINTSATVLIVLISLLLLGGESIRNFILALTLGVAIGTYSSIFNASPLLVTWQKWADARDIQAGKKK